MPMRCHYEVLGVEQQATADDIKKTYRKLALKWHPDKNPDNIAECTKVFTLIQKAYDVLSDANERAWYDSHRDSLMRGADGDGSSGEEGVDLVPYFSPDAYAGFGDDEDGFYTVFAKLFERIAKDEAQFYTAADAARQDRYEIPPSDDEDEVDEDEVDEDEEDQDAKDSNKKKTKSGSRKAKRGGAATPERPNRTESPRMLESPTPAASDAGGHGSKNKKKHHNNQQQQQKAEESASRKQEANTSMFPPFGKSTSPYETVGAAFYNHWSAFSTRRPFASKDLYDTREAPNRQIKRLMEKDNQKQRDKARKEYNDNVIQLVAYLRKRDKRVHAYLERMEREQDERASKHKQRLKEEKMRRAADAEQYRHIAASNLKEMEDDLALVENALDDFHGKKRKGKKGKDANKGANRAAAASDDAAQEDGSSTPAEANETTLSPEGEDALADGSSSGTGVAQQDDMDDDDEPEELLCVACKKVFKSQKAWENHERSKKHLEKVALLRAILEAEDEAMAQAASGLSISGNNNNNSNSNSNSNNNNSAAAAPSPAGKGGKRGKKSRRKAASSDEDDSDQDY
ncbi:GS3 protein [Capsaspora owczarzaki ATCC 30864]|uniref:GS3 protein n=1 Tax=Capsaspora owczarzaki (strain ATCC 30864) TaxID=595528 RepID=A0A0D2X4M7_CAPO3|nr:GS3 protein [Capsaspora owczarzaki ATCC 30864]KJE96329.1 GS3 protein [Capsaspora owczarzaki ATCC 30864]|eukprot:XP_004344291.1 GS3 protein [Capsaspora owczarzaki ATCC 30864]